MIDARCHIVSAVAVGLREAFALLAFRGFLSVTDCAGVREVSCTSQGVSGPEVVARTREVVVHSWLPTVGEAAAYIAGTGFSSQTLLSVGLRWNVKRPFIGTTISIP